MRVPSLASTAARLMPMTSSDPSKPSFWLFKSEPDAYSIDDLANDKVEHWDGIRNYQARNFIRDDMRIGDLVLFYHSNVKPPAVVGLARIVSEAYPDHTAFDPNEKYYDPKSDPDAPRWLMVDVEYVRHLRRPVTLPELRAEEEALDGLLLLAKGSRLSVVPVAEHHFQHILAMAEEPSEE